MIDGSGIFCELGLFEHHWTLLVPHGTIPWASWHIRKIAGCACPWNAGNVFPSIARKQSRHASRHVRDARAVMHVGIVNLRFPLKSVAGKRSRHSRRMRNPQFCVSGKRTITRTKYDQDLGRLIPSLCQNQFTYWFMVTHSVYSKTNVPRDLIGHGAHVTIMWPIQQPYRNVKHQCSASMLCQIEW